MQVHGLSLQIEKRKKREYWELRDHKWKTKGKKVASSTRVVEFEFHFQLLATMWAKSTTLWE